MCYDKEFSIVRNLRTRTTNDIITLMWDVKDICSGSTTYFVTLSSGNETVLASAVICYHNYRFDEHILCLIW